MGGRRERIEITLYGGRPWGFSIKGGSESNKPLVISKVEPRGKAERSGLCVGDNIYSVNNVPLSGMRAEAIKLVKTSGGNLVLEIERGVLPYSERQILYQNQAHVEPQHDREYPQPYERNQESILSNASDGYNVQRYTSPIELKQQYDEGPYFSNEKLNRSTEDFGQSDNAVPSSGGDVPMHQGQASHLDDITNMVTDDSCLPLGASLATSSLLSAAYPSSIEIGGEGKRRSDEDRKSWNSLSSYNASNESLDKREPAAISHGPAMRHRRSHHNRNTERPNSWHASKHSGVEKASLSPTSSSPTPILDDKRMRFPGDDGYSSSHLPRSSYYSQSHQQHQSRRKSKGWTESGDLRSTLKGDINGSKDSILSWSSRQSNRSSRLSCSSSKSSGNMSGSRGSIDNLDSYHVPNPQKNLEDPRRKSPASAFPQHARKSSSPSEVHPGNVSSKKYLFEKLSHGQHETVVGKMSEVPADRRLDPEDPNTESNSKKVFGQQQFYDSPVMVSSQWREEVGISHDDDSARKTSLSPHSHMPQFRKSSYQAESADIKKQGKLDHITRHDGPGVSICYADARVVTSTVDMQRGNTSTSEGSSLKSIQSKGGAQLPVFASAEPEQAAQVYPVHPVSPSIASPVTEDLKMSDSVGGQERLFGVMAYNSNDGKNVVAKTITIASPQRTPISSPVLRRARQDKVAPGKSSTSPSRYEYLSDAYSGSEPFPNLKPGYQSRMEDTTCLPANRQKEIEMPSANEVPEPYFNRANALVDNKNRASGRYGEVWKTPLIPRRRKEPNKVGAVLAVTASGKKLANANANNSKLSVFKPLGGDAGSQTVEPCSASTSISGQDGTPAFAVVAGAIQPSLDAKSRRPIYQSAVSGNEDDEIMRRLRSPERYGNRLEISSKQEQKLPSSPGNSIAELRGPDSRSRETLNDHYGGIATEIISSKKNTSISAYRDSQLEGDEDDAFASQNDEYRNNIKGMSKKVLRVTSFTRKDLELSPSFRMFEQQRQAFEYASRFGVAKEEEERSQLSQYIHRRSKSQGNDLEESAPVGRPRAGTGTGGDGWAGHPLVKSLGQYQGRPKSAGVRDNNHRVESVCPLSTLHHVANKTSPEHRRVEIEVRPPEAPGESAGKSKPQSAIARRLAQNRLHDAQSSKMDARNAVLGFYFKKTGKAVDGSVKKTTRAKSMSQFPQPTSPVNKEITNVRPPVREGGRVNRLGSGPMRAKSTSSLLDAESAAQLAIVSVNNSSTERVRDHSPSQRSGNDLRSSSMENLTADLVTHPAKGSAWTATANSNLQKPQGQVMHRSVYKFNPSSTKPLQASPPESTAKVAPFMYQLLQAGRHSAANMSKTNAVNKEENSMRLGNVSAGRESEVAPSGKVSPVKSNKPGSSNAAATHDSANVGTHSDTTRNILPKSQVNATDERNKDVSFASRANVDVEAWNASASAEARLSMEASPAHGNKNENQNHSNKSSRSPELLPQAPQRRRRKKGQASITSSSSSSSGSMGTNISPSRKSVPMMKKLSVASIKASETDLPLPPPPPPPESKLGSVGPVKKRSVGKIATSALDLPLPPPPPPPESQDQLSRTPETGIPESHTLQVAPAVADTYREETYLLGTDSSSEGDPLSKRNSRNILPGATIELNISEPSPDEMQSNFLRNDVSHTPTESMDTVMSSESHETVISQKSDDGNGTMTIDDKTAETESVAPAKEMPTFTQGMLSSTLDMLEAGYRFAKSTPADIFLNTQSEFQRTAGDSLSTSNLPVSSTYYHTSASKAKIMHLVQEKVEGGEIDEDVESEEEINGKKMQLVASIFSKMSELQKVKDLIKTEMKENDELGAQVHKLVESTCTSKEREKFSTFVEEVDKIINLILSISGRLARVENALSSLSPDAEQEERSSLLEKREKLSRQQEEADTLKLNVDNRQKAVSEMLSKYLNTDQFTDYEHYIKMKMTLIMEKRELDDKMKLGEEQMECLRDSLPDDCHESLDALLEERRDAEGAQPEEASQLRDPISSKLPIASSPD